MTGGDEGRALSSGAAHDMLRGLGGAVSFPAIGHLFSLTSPACPESAVSVSPHMLLWELVLT